MGGTVDPETGQVIWTLHTPLEQQLAHYHAHPPRALAGLTSTPTTVDDFTFDGHGEPVNAVFSVACKCGNATFHVLCGLDDDDAISPAIVINCATCDNGYDIFETDMGWDGELHPSGRAHPSGVDDFDPVNDLDGRAHPSGVDDFDPVNDLEPPEFPAPHGIVVRFEYGSETLGDPQSPDLAGREHDLFTWITIIAREPTTGALSFLFDYECA